MLVRLSPLIAAITVLAACGGARVAEPDPEHASTPAAQPTGSVGVAAAPAEPTPPQQVPEENATQAVPQGFEVSSEVDPVEFGLLGALDSDLDELWYDDGAALDDMLAESTFTAADFQRCEAMEFSDRSAAMEAEWERLNCEWLLYGDWGYGYLSDTGAEGIETYAMGRSVGLIEGGAFEAIGGLGTYDGYYDEYYDESYLDDVYMDDGYDELVAGGIGGLGLSGVGTGAGGVVDGGAIGLGSVGLGGEVPVTVTLLDARIHGAPAPEYEEHFELGNAAAEACWIAGDPELGEFTLEADFDTNGFVLDVRAEGFDDPALEECVAGSYWLDAPEPWGAPMTATFTGTYEPR